MRKLIKINSFAIEYQAEIAKHSENNHPNYESSDFRSSYYYDVYYSLLIAQNGLCAYSESLIIDDILQSDLKANFINGKYNDKDIGKADGDIEHYNPKLKVNNGWRWDNLFIVRIFINRDIKKSHTIDDIFKPDNKEYHPRKYFKYNNQKHVFVANPEIEDPDLINKINYTLEKMGINSATIISERREYINNLNQNKIDNKELIYTEKTFTKFPTACIDYFNVNHNV